MWASSNKVTPQDWIQLIKAVLENGLQLLWQCYQREEAKILQQQGKTKGLRIPQDQILGESLYSDPQDQALYNEHTLSLCISAALNAWDRIQELRIELNHILGLNRVRENHSDFLQRLAETVQTVVTDPEARCVVIKSLAFENANLECKRILGLLKVRSALNG